MASKFVFRFSIATCSLALWLQIAVISQLVISQEQPEDWPSSYSVGPYKHVYPPTNISIDQLSCVPDISTNKTCPLFILLIMSFGGSYTSSGVVPGIQVALDQINASPGLLPGYTLHYTLLDSQCEHTTALNALHTGMFEPPTKIAVIGSGCSVATEPTAEISHYYNLTQLSCTSSSTELMNRNRFQRHFQLSTPDISLAYGFFGVIQYAKWRKVTIAFQDASLFTTTVNELTRLLDAVNVAYSEIRFDSNVDLFSNSPDSRVFILSMYPVFAREILCQAYKRNYRYPRAQLFVNGWYPENWWVGSPEEQKKLEKKYRGCSVEQRKSLVEYILAVSTSGRTVLDYSAKADNGYSGADVQAAYDHYLNASLLNVTDLFLYQICYDAVWTLARALNGTLTELGNQSILDFGLQHFSYNNSVLLENIFKHLSETNFNCIVGNITFNEFGGRHIDTVDLRQYQYTESKSTIRTRSVGTVHRITEFQFNVTFVNGISSIWPDGIPYDGVPAIEVISIHTSVTVVFSILATCGIIIAVLCLIINIKLRKKKIIKLTSPYLNCLIVAGAAILYVNMYIYVTPSTSRKTEAWLCNLDSWLTAIGYSLCYGTILAKMCRVYYLFHNPSMKKKRAVKDWMLAVGVALLIVIDILILTTYSIVAVIIRELNSNIIPNHENRENIVGIKEETYRYFVYVCNSQSRSITLGVLYGYKAMLQIVALAFAVSIRKVQIKGLNDAVYIIAAIYVTSIVTTVIIVSTYTLVELVNVYAVVFSLCLFIGTTVILMLVFIPPLLTLYKDPDGKTIFNSDKVITTNVKEKSTTKSETDIIASLNARIAELECQLAI